MGKYRLIAELGRGGMADVYLAVALGPGGFNKLLVIKQLRTGDDPTLVTMFLDEARLAARMSHPNIVQTFEVVQEASRAFMVMEFLDGASLSRLRRMAKKNGVRVPLAIELHIMKEALGGLHAAHELRGYDGLPLNVVHRDFTPQNLMTTYSGDTKIVDFGIAKAVDQEGKTSAGMFKGKLTYVPPEQLMGTPVDRRTDIFAAGVMLFEAVTGESPWQGKTNAQITHELATGRVPRLMENAHAPPELAAIIDEAMAVDPDARYATADEMRLALEEFIREQGMGLDRARLGAWVSETMGAVQEQTRKFIEYQLQSSTLPSADTLTQSLPSLELTTPSPAVKQTGRSVPVLMGSEAMPDTGAGTSPSVPPPPTGTPRGLLAGMGVVLVGLVVAVAFLAFRPTPAPVVVPVPVTPPPVVVAPVPAPTIVAPPPAPVAAVVAEPPPAPKLVTLHFSATPASARLFLDALELPTNPYEGQFPFDARMHELRATAPGHVEARRGLQFDRDTTLDLPLTPEAPVARPHAASAAPAGKKPAKPEDDPEYFAPAAPDKKQPAPKRPMDDVQFE
jgi:serine/threonine-protein kinase